MIKILYSVICELLRVFPAIIFFLKTLKLFGIFSKGLSTSFKKLDKWKGVYFSLREQCKKFSIGSIL